MSWKDVAELLTQGEEDDLGWHVEKDGWSHAVSHAGMAQMIANAQLLEDWADRLAEVQLVCPDALGDIDGQWSVNDYDEEHKPFMYWGWHERGFCIHAEVYRVGNELRSEPA